MKGNRRMRGDLKGFRVTTGVFNENLSFYLIRIIDKSDIL
jgi:hypothetical protein